MIFKSRPRKHVQEFSATQARIDEIWFRFEERLPGNIMSYRTPASPNGTLTNLTPEQFEKCLRVLSGEG